MAAFEQLPGNAHWRIRLDRAHDLLILERTPVSFESLEAVTAVHSGLVDLVRAIEGKKPTRLLLDFRNGPPGRNDPGFERATQGVRRSLTELFGRVAVLVRSAAGKLQNSRLLKEEGVAGGGMREVFTDEAEALAWLLRIT
jgi:hypothetical protein